MRALAIALLIGCGGSDSDDPPLPACTPEEQDVPEGNEPVTVELVDLFGSSITCDAPELFITSGMLDTKFGGTVPPQLAAVDFAVDRVLIALSNPGLQFVAEIPIPQLYAGFEGICQGIAPTCEAYILRGTVSDVITFIACPYRGPDPCLAP